MLNDSFRRYIHNRNVQNLNNEMLDIPDRFKTFINENIVSYTQIFVRLVPRFLKMDLSLNKNAFMLFRMLKVFRQPSDILRDIEKQMRANNNSSAVMRSHNSTFHDSSIHSSPPRLPNRSAERFSPHPFHRSHNQSAIEDSNYVYMFSDEVVMQVYELMQRSFLAKLKTSNDVSKMEKEVQKHSSAWDKFKQFIGWISSLSLSFSLALDEKKKTPIYLDFCLNVLSPIFDIPIEEATREFELLDTMRENSDDEQANTTNSDFLNVTPSFMKQQSYNISYQGDPFLLPIMAHEVKFLVRFFHQISCKLNETVKPSTNSQTTLIKLF